MTKTALDQIVALLPRLASNEIEQVRQRLAAMQSLGGGEPSVMGGISGSSNPTRDDSMWVLGVICDTMRSMGVERTSAERLRTTADYGPFRAKVDDLMAFLALADTKTVTQSRLVHRRALLSVGVQMLYDDLHKMNLPISTRVIMRHIHRLPSIFDLHFPGYARFGMLGFIIRDRVNRGTNVREQSTGEDATRGRQDPPRRQG